MKHLASISQRKPAVASAGLQVLLGSVFNLMGTLVVLQRQSAWKTPFPQLGFVFDDETDTGGGGGGGGGGGEE